MAGNGPKVGERHKSTNLGSRVKLKQNKPKEIHAELVIIKFLKTKDKGKKS